MDKVKSMAIHYLATRVRSPDDAIMFDIDDTLIKVDNTPIREMITLYKFAEMIGYKMVIITARPYYDENVLWTSRQLLEIGINPYNTHYCPPRDKGKLKFKLGYNFIICVGDQWTDLTNTHKWIKLPDTNDRKIMTNI